MLLPSRNQFCLVQKLFLVRFEILSQNWHLTSMYFLGERKLLPLFCDFTGHKSWIISCERHSIPSLLITSRYSRPKSTWVDMKKKKSTSAKKHFIADGFTYSFLCFVSFCYLELVPIDVLKMLVLSRTWKWSKLSLIYLITSQQHMLTTSLYSNWRNKLRLTGLINMNINLLAINISPVWWRKKSISGNGEHVFVEFY